MKLWHKVTIGLILGIIVGIIAGEKTVYIKPVGDIFMNMIRMIIVPLIFFSLVTGISNISDPKSLGRIGAKSCFAYLATTSVAILTGIAIAVFFEPGAGKTLDLGSMNLDKVNVSMVKEFSYVGLLTGIVPQNAIAAMAEGNMLQIVFFSIFTGITIIKMGKSGKLLAEYCQVMAKFVFKMVSIIIEFSPYGAFALTAWVVGTQGTTVLFLLGKLVCYVMLGMVIQYLIFGVLIYVFAKMSPLPFYKKSFEYQALAFSTSSSKATLSTTMKVCQERLGISSSSTSFVLPLGAAMNMDGMAIYLGISAIFFAQVTGVDLSFHDYIIVVLTATIGSIGGAGVPGSSMIMLPMILTAINVPIEGVALIAGIDRILDMVRTTINITGDATITMIVDKSEGTLNEEIYYSD
jgi:Na+/H+-dicarboxylate symporter